MSDPTGQAFGNGVGASGLGTADFLTGALFNQLFPSSAPALTPTASRAGSSPGLFDFGMMPTGGEIGSAAGGPGGSSTGGSTGGPGGGPAGGFPSVGAQGTVGGDLAANAPSAPFGFGYPGPIGAALGPVGQSLFNAALGQAPGALMSGGLPGVGTLTALANLLSGHLQGLNTDPGSGLTITQLNGLLADPANMGWALDLPVNMNAASSSPVSAQTSSPTGGNEAGFSLSQASTGTPFSANPAARSGQDPDAGAPGPNGPNTDTAGPSPTQGDPTGQEGGTSGGGGPSGDGGASLLCNYALNGGACTDKEAQTHRRNFGALAERAFREHPALKDSFEHYRGAARQIIGRIEGMDQPRRKVAMQGLKTNLVSPFAAAAKKGDVMGAGRVLRRETMRLAKQHGVQIPTAHITASESVLGPVGEG
jgi:hypothetical protein